MSLFFSIGVSGIMLCYSYELGTSIYQSVEAAKYIKLLAPLIPIMYFDSTVDAMLKGLGEQVYSMNVNIIDSSLSVVLVWLTLPVLGIEGYLVTIYITELLNAALSIVRLLNVSNIKPRIFKWIAKPLISIVGATALSRLISSCLLNVTVAKKHEVFFLITLTALLYILIACITSAFDKDDIKWIVKIIKKDSKTPAKS